MWSGSAGHLHALEPAPVRRQVWVMEPDRPALVLGSAQTDDVVDRAALERRGVDVVRRRSGGGAVLVEPGSSRWIDVVIPRGDPLWEDDVSRSFEWLGEAWVETLAAFGVEGRVHRGRPLRTGWSPLVCFAGVGSGEVLVEGRKVVGLSQRRTRTWARFQSLVPTRGASVSGIAELLVTSGDGDGRADLRAELDRTCAVVDVVADRVSAAFVAVLSGDVGAATP